jgi:hypothetical protein
VTPNIFQPSYPSLHLPTIPNHPFAFLLRKKAVDGKNLRIAKRRVVRTALILTNLVRITAYCGVLMDVFNTP